MRAESHAGDNATGGGGAGVPPSSESSTCTGDKWLSDHQRDDRELVKRFAHDVSADTCGKPAIARALGKSESYGRKLCDPTDPLPLALGDVMMIGRTQPDFARELLFRCLKELDDRAASPTLTIEAAQRRITAQDGLFAATLEKALHDDNRVSPDEARELLSTLRPLRNRVDDAIKVVELVIR